MIACRRLAIPALALLLATPSFPFRESQGQAQDLLRKAIIARDSGDLDGAISIFRRVLSEDPGQLEARFQLGLALLAKNSWLDAAGEFRKFVQKRPGSYEAHNNLAAIYARLGMREELAQELATLASLRPGSAQAQLNLSDFHLSISIRALWRAFLSADAADRPSLLVRLESLLGAVPESGEVLFVRANIARELGESGKVRDLLARAGKMDSLFEPESLLEDARRLAAAGQPGDALEILLCLEAAGQPSRQSQLLLADTLGRLGRYEESLQRLEAIRQDSGQDLQLHLAMAEAWTGLGQPDKAVTALEAALALEARPEIRRRLAQAYRAKGDFGRALSEYEKLLRTEADPSWVRREIVEISRQKLASAEKTNGGAPGASTAGRTLPESLLSMMPGERCLLVDKESQAIFLYRRTADAFELERTFACSTGARDGEKLTQGDQKTPEGIYLFQRIIPGSELPEKYGQMAITLDYPNPYDLIDGRSGDGIWLHATDEVIRPYLPNNTRGCVVVSNEDIQALSRLIALDRTPIVIVASIRKRTPEENGRVAAELKSLLERWKAGWERMDLDAYIAAYSARFRTGAQDLAAWKTYKESVFARAGRIQLRVDLQSIFLHEKYAVMTIRQEYRSQRLTSKGTKRLFVALENGSWRIIAESWREDPA